MKTKMKSKSKRGKAIIGIAMAAIMIASVFAAMVPTASAYAYSGAKYTVPGTMATVIQGTKEVDISAFVMQASEITTSTASITIVGKEGTDIEGEPHPINDISNFEVETTWSKGLYVISENESYTIFVDEPMFTLETRKVVAGAITADKVSSCVKNEQIGFVLTSNLYIISNGAAIPDGVTYKVTDAKDVPRDQKANLDSSGNNELVFAGTDKVGEYTVYVETDDSVCNGLDATSSEIKFTVTELGISISADKDRIATGKEVTLTGATSPKTPIWINVTSGTKGDVEFKGGKGQYTGADYTPTITVPGVSVTTKNDGTYTVVAKISDTGTYEFEARVAGTTTYKKETVEVTDIIAEITTDKTSYAAGEDIEITGTSSTGTYAIIAFDEKVVAYETIKSDDTFSFTLSGVNKAAGSYKIEAFIYPTTVVSPIPTTLTCDVLTGTSTSDLKNKDGDSATADASTAVLLITGELTASISTKKAAFGDDFTVSGEAPGMKDVTVLVVAPRGTDAKGIGDKYKGNSGLSLKIASVSSVDYTFSLKRDAPKTDIDTGKYMVIVIAPGRDGDYGRSGAHDSVDAAITAMDYSIGSKTQEQFLAIVDDMSDPRLSDDTVWVDYVWLETGFVKLDKIIEGVASGETLTITGTTNRKDDYPIMVTVEGPTTLEPVNVKAEGGKFNASFSTSGADPGTYTVTADDGDGHTSILIVEDLIKTAVEVPEVPEEVPEVPEEVPEVPEEVPEVPEEVPEVPEEVPEEPGFEAVFAIAGMLAIAYLVLRRRK